MLDIVDFTLTEGNIMAGVVIPPLNYPYVTAFSYGRKGPNNKAIVMIGPMASTSNTFDESQTK